MLNHNNQRCRVLGGGALFVMLLTVSALVGPEWMRQALDRRAGQRGQSQPTNLWQLVALSPNHWAAQEIASLNFMCAAGLPGMDGGPPADSIDVIAQWADRVGVETRRHEHQFRRNPDHFQNSWAYFRMLTLVTVLQQDFGVHYDEAQKQAPDFSDSKALFLSGLLGAERRGTCVSMPVLYVAVGRRLGYPLKLVTARGHLFARWDGAGERLNLEATNAGLNCYPDDYYQQWPVPLAEKERQAGMYLESLDAAGELAVFLSVRGHCLEAHGCYAEAQVAHALAHQLAPLHPAYLGFLAGAVAHEMPSWEKIKVDLGLPRSSQAFPAAAGAVDASPSRWPVWTPYPLRN